MKLTLSTEPNFILGADLQMVNISMRVLSKPSVEKLPDIFKVGCHIPYCNLFSD